MKKFILAVHFLFVSVVIAISPVSAIASEDSAEIAAILKADGDWLATSKSGEDFIGYTDPDFTFFPPGAPFMDDKKKMIAHWNAIVNTPGLELVWGPTLAVVSKGGDLGFSSGWYTLKTVDEAGKVNVAKGKYLTVMRKQANGEWRPLADIFNADSN